MNFIFAAPSYVRPGTIWDNCRFLSDLVSEVGLLFFETSSCLAYGENDLSKSLADLPLRYHVHLPLDLPWNMGGAAVADIAIKLAVKVDFLSPHAFVLHPPQDSPDLIEFVENWKNQGRSADMLLLENIKENDLTELWPAIQSLGCRVCLDLGHLLAYGQHAILDLPGLWPLVGMVHLSAPGDHGKHGPLSGLKQTEIDLLKNILKHVSAETVLMVEVFDEPNFLTSLQWLKQHLQNLITC